MGTSRRTQCAKAAIFICVCLQAASTICYACGVACSLGTAPWRHAPATVFPPVAGSEFAAPGRPKSRFARVHGAVNRTAGREGFPKPWKKGVMNLVYVSLLLLSIYIYIYPCIYVYAKPPRTDFSTSQSSAFVYLKNKKPPTNNTKHQKQQF